MKLFKILCIALLTAGVANAEPVFGPYAPDYRGDENSVHAVWDIVPFPIPVIFETGQSSYPLEPTPPELFYDGILAQITLPNFIDNLPMKMMRIQLGFNVPVSPGEFALLDILGNPPVMWQIVGGSEGVDTWHYIDIEMFPNPDFEQIVLLTPFQYSLFAIEIDTISIPEPASIGLLGLISGGIYFARRFFLV